MNDIKDCVYCAEDKCRLCTLFCDYHASKHRLECAVINFECVIMELQG